LGDRLGGWKPLREVSDDELPEATRFRNWIPVAREDARLAETVDRLVVALEADLERERRHTR
jgi:hypothetical protein